MSWLIPSLAYRPTGCQRPGHGGAGDSWEKHTGDKAMEPERQQADRQTENFSPQVTPGRKPRPLTPAPAPNSRLASLPRPSVQGERLCPGPPRPCRPELLFIFYTCCLDCSNAEIPGMALISTRQNAPVLPCPPQEIPFLRKALPGPLTLPWRPPCPRAPGAPGTTAGGLSSPRPQPPPSGRGRAPWWRR